MCGAGVGAPHLEHRRDALHHVGATRGHVLRALRLGDAGARVLRVRAAVQDLHLLEDGGLAAAACRGTLSCAATPARPDLCPAAAA